MLNWVCTGRGAGSVYAGGEEGMGHFYFVRHGQTVWNVENKICGAADSPLTEKGHEQAKETGRMLKERIDNGEIHIDQILTSPLSRAYDTAVEISHMTGVPVTVEPRLIEQNFGKWEGTARDGAAFARAKESFADSYGGGESMMRLAQRIYNLMDDLRKEPEKTCLLVAHNGISRMIESYFRDMSNEEFAAFGIKNAEVREYKFEDDRPEDRTDYGLLCQQLTGLMDGVESHITILSNAAALLYEILPGINWAGFYISHGDELLLGPFQGKTACVRIPYGKGVCGTAAAENRTIAVENVHKFAGHIACDSASQSEIVVPIHKDGRAYGVLDIDSPVLNRFDNADREGLERFVKLLEAEMANE